MPAPNKTPVRVEGAPAALSELLVDHCRMPAQPWLFRVREPGLAQEVRTNSVRPGEEYILVAPELPDTCHLLGAEGITVTTQGVEGTRFTIPSDVDDALIATLRHLGLGLVSDVVLWPAGIVPAAWDGEGEATWPAGDDPIIGIKSQRRVARCVVSTAEDVMEVLWPPDRDTVFLRLTDLEMGTHSVEILLLGADESEAPVAVGGVTVGIREPADSASSASLGQGIQTWAYPPRQPPRGRDAGRPRLAQGYRANAVPLVRRLRLPAGTARLLREDQENSPPTSGARASATSASPATGRRWRTGSSGESGSTSTSPARSTRAPSPRERAGASNTKPSSTRAGVNLPSTVNSSNRSSVASAVPCAPSPNATILKSFTATSTPPPLTAPTSTTTSSTTPERGIIENCFNGEAAPLSKPDEGFYLDGYYHGHPRGEEPAQKPPSPGWSSSSPTSTCSTTRSP